MVRARLALLAFACGAALTACAGSRPDLGAGVPRFDRIEEDARRQGLVSPAADALRAGREAADRASLLLSRKKAGAAAPLLEEAIAAGEAALEAGIAARAEEARDGCLLAAERARTGWEEASRALEQAARIAGREVKLKAPAAASTDLGGLPESSWEAATPPDWTAEELRSSWDAWRKAAADRRVPSHDLVEGFERALRVSALEKTAAEEKIRQLALAGRRVQALEGRVRAEVAREECLQAAARIAAYGGAEADALSATLDLERSLKEDLRSDLERARAEAEDRQKNLYDSLHQLEGKLIQIRQDARGTIISLADILFDFDRATLKRDVEFGLVKVSTILNQFPEMRIQIEGHTDNIGKPEYNLDLSRRRAQAVHDFLVSQEVVAPRMTVEGYGMTRPVADNGTEEGRQKNRRVDLVIQDRP